MKIRRKQGREVVQQTGSEYQADLWHHQDYGTLGDPLFDRAPQVDSCEQCGKPTQGLPLCDECNDTNGDQP